MVNRISFPVKGNYIDGQFKICTDPNGEWTSRSPGDNTDELGKIHYSYRAIDDAVSAARIAFRTWKSRSSDERASYLRKVQGIISRRGPEISQAIAREVGRPLWDAQEEIAAVVNKIDVMIQDGLRLIHDFDVSNAVEGAQGACRRRPLGVAAVIGPFNAPAAQPCEHLIPALLSGNAIVFKPSEKAAIVGQLLADCFHEAELPTGVFNLVQGDREAGRRLAVHEGVDAVLFTGSYEVGTRIKQDTLQQHWKLLVLQMGTKNPAIIWEDANFDLALKETLVAGFISAGQRCSATSRVLVHDKLVEAFVEKLHERAKAFTIGDPLENPFMGPLIDASSVDRYMKFQGIAVREGCETIMRGKTLDLPKQGYYVAPSICRVKKGTIEATRKSVYQQSEILGPNIAIIAVSDLEEAVAQANATQYGLVASVYTRSREVFGFCQDELQFGMINWNRPTLTASSRLPYAGRKKSGNHFPGGVFSMLYSTQPLALLEDPERRDNDQVTPGLNWS